MNTHPHRNTIVLAAITMLLSLASLHAADDIRITPDLVYGHKNGMALTMDLFQPPHPNGAAVLFMVSGGWFSTWSPPEQTVGLFRPLLDKNFTVFAVRHGSSPKYLVPEIVNDVRRSVRFVRSRAADYHIDPDRLGVWGFSAGGHLSLMLGTASDNGDPDAKDPILRTGDRVAAVVAYFPPTDLSPFITAGSPYPKNYPALRFDPNDVAAVSPIMHVSSDDPPTLLIHGNKDFLVPVSHSEKMHAALKDKGVPSDLLIIEGAAHGFGGDDAKRANDAWIAWFEKYLLSPKP
jgi:acetyl esterase/lipase